MKNKQRFLYLGILSSIVLTACGEATNNAENNQASEVDDNTANIVEVEDSDGNLVDVPLNPEGVAVFDNGQIDNLDSLGLGDNIVITASENMPEHLNDYEHLPVAGTLHEVDLETTFAEDPELAIVAGRSQTSFDSLSEFVPTIDLTHNTEGYWENLETNLNRLGTIFDVEEEAIELAQELEDQMYDVASHAEESDLTTLVSMYNEGSLSVYGPGSRFGVVHDEFGFEPIDSDIEDSNHGMEVSHEYILEQDPDILFVIDRTEAIGGDDSGETLEENPIIQETQAYQNDQIIYLTPDAWYLAEGGAQTFEIMLDEVSTVLD